MADLTAKKLLLNFLLSQGVAHPAGHITEMQEAGIPAYVDISQGIEQLEKPRDAYQPSLLAALDGAGIRAQDRISEASTDPNYLLANALGKLGYLFGAHKKVFGSQAGGAGDFENLAETKGEKGKEMMKAGVLLSALSDIYRASNPETPWALLFDQSSNGTPMVKLNYKF